MALHKEIKHMVLSLSKQIRRNTPLKNFNHNQIAKYDVRIGHVDGKEVRRFVIHFRSNGCSWCRETGGCSMCGFWTETTQNKSIITGNEFVNQFRNAMIEHNLQKYVSLSMFNAGSLLQEKEIPFSAVEEIFFLIKGNLQGLRQLFIETRVEHITEEKLKRLKEILGNNIQLTVGMGFESYDDTIRNLIINKGVSKGRLEKCVELLKCLDINSMVYLIIKPPFLTEQESIEDVIDSTRYLVKIGVSHIGYETMTVEDNTLLNVLYEQGYYELPWLWSIIEILNRVNPFCKPILTPLSYITDSKDVPKNCPVCTNTIKARIYRDYCSDFDITHFSNLDCNCKSVWLQMINDKNPLSLEERAYKILLDLSKISEIGGVKSFRNG
jgi:radical SAM enzyme (TIGR01210 family)